MPSPVDDALPPDDGAYYDLSWTIVHGRITAMWTAREPPEETSSLTTEDRLLAAEGTIEAHDREIDEIVAGLGALANG